jgi:hypothetical protein
VPAQPRHYPSTSGGWQDRINSLFVRKEGDQALAVDSASKNAFDHSAQRPSATVSLPGSTAQTAEEAYNTKPMAEECFEEQEMGFVPPIHIPKDTPDNAWRPAPAPKPMPRKFQMLDSDSARSINFQPQYTKDGELVPIQLPGMTDRQRVTVAVKTERQRSNPRRPITGRGSSQRHPSGRGRGSKDSPVSGSTPGSEQGQANSPTTGPRESGRGRGVAGRGGWNQRHASGAAPAITNNS